MLRVYETVSDPTSREVCGYLLVRGSVHAHAYALALEKITGVKIKDFLPTPNIPLSKIPECQKYLDGLAPPPLYVQPGRLQGNGRHLGQWRGRASDDPPGELEVVDACRKAARSTS